MRRKPFDALLHMPTVVLSGQGATTLEVRLSRAEHVLGLLPDLRVPVTAIVRAEVVENGLTAARGMRRPGSDLPGVGKYGTWRHRGNKQYVAVRRGIPALHLSLIGQRYQDVVVSTAQAAQLADHLERLMTASTVRS
jgi:hypothetical protein